MDSFVEFREEGIHLGLSKHSRDSFSKIYFFYS